MMITTQESQVRTGDEHYIAALARLMDDRILKDNDSFAVFDQHGNINLVNDEQGIFHSDTRYLSRLSLQLNGQSPVLLGSTVRDDNALLTIDLTNAEFEAQTNGSSTTVRSGTIHIHRTMFLATACCYEQFTIRNHGSYALHLKVRIEFGADYKDIFEVRGEKRDERGTTHEPHVEPSRVSLRYVGLDDVKRSTVLCWSPTPDAIDGESVEYDLQVGSKQQVSHQLVVRMEDSRTTPEHISLDDARENLLRRCGDSRRQTCTITTSNDAFNGWVNRSFCDVNMMASAVGDKLRYPFAGVPWYNTVFGRDGLIVALQTLWCDSSIARGVLKFLAHTQSDDFDAERDAEPGKIVHEMRKCEMALTGEVPFERYYGTVDATPLFVMLAGQYFETTGDLDTIQQIWPNIERALTWIDECGDHNGDGFIDYECKSSSGLTNQGWKDSFDSIMRADGELATGPIALAEVQGYVYQARCLAASMANSLGHSQIAATLRKRAQQLKEQFDEQFWSEEMQQYAIAIDGGTHRCAVRSSNPGHCLYTGIVPEHRAAAVADSLMDDDMFSGWGVRTLSTSAARYNPASYHNGSVWPHDNSIIAAGMARYGFTGYALQILMGQFHVSTWMERFRLPELFCGFKQQDKTGPVGYPVACSPQAWASGAVFLMLGGALGLSVNAADHEVRLQRPSLPKAIEHVHIGQLRVGDGEISLDLTRHEDTVRVAVSDQIGPVRVVVTR